MANENGNNFIPRDIITGGKISEAVKYLALPMFVTQLLHTAINLVDMIWVGKLGAVALASVAMAGTVLMIVVVAIMGLATGTRAMVARAVGEKNDEFASRIAGQSLAAGLLGAAFLAVFGYIFSPAAFRILGASPEVTEQGVAYLRILLVGGVGTFGLFLANAIFYGCGDARTPLRLMLAACAINLLLDPLLIFGIGFPRLEVRGAALASVIAQGIMAFFAFFILFHRHHLIKLSKVSFFPQDGLIWRIFKIGIPASFEMTFRSLMAVVLMGIVAGYGTAAIAAYGIGLRLRMVLIMPGLSMGSAAATLVGQNLGADKAKRAKKSARQVALYNVMIMAVGASIYLIFSRQIIGFFNSNPEIIAIGVSFLKITAPFYIFSAVSVVLGRAIGGAGDTIPPMIITLITLWAIQVPLAVVLPKVAGLGITGVWWAMSTASVTQALGLLSWFELGKWRHKRI